MDINLLPWREEIVTYNKKIFLRLMLSVIVLSALFLIFSYNLFFSQVSYTKSYTLSLEQAKTHLVGNLTAFFDQQKVQKEANARFLALQQLQLSRFDTIRLLNDVVKITPKGVYLQSLSRNGNEIKFSGEANSNLLIAELIKAINLSKNLDISSVQKVEKQEGNKLIVEHFDLFAVLTLPSLMGNTKTEEKAPIKNPIETIQKKREEQTKKIEEQGKS